MSDTVRVRVIDSHGSLTAPLQVSKLILSDAQWKMRLTPDQYRITRHADTEAPYCGGLLKNKEAGIYACVGCDLPLFDSDAKFESGTGWPSFFQPVAAENVLEKRDTNHGMSRTEIVCARCDAHLGHVFNDGPKPTGQRFCLNSESLRFVPRKNLASIAYKPATQPATQPSHGPPQPLVDLPEKGPQAQAVFAGGCFWCVEGVFEELSGVKEVVSGYAGDTRDKARYEVVSHGRTNHAEAVQIVYDPAKISFGQLLRVFFATHDPTTLNRQGPDSGRQYRSAIFYAGEDQKRVAEAYIRQLDEAALFKSKIVTTLEPLEEFYKAEEYHQDYVCRNPGNPYIKAWAAPKLDKLRETFPEQVKSTP